MRKLARIASYDECAKARTLLDQGVALLAWRRSSAGRELILKSSSGADQAIVAPKFHSEFSAYAGRWKT